MTGAQFATNEVLQSGLTLLQVARQVSGRAEFLADHAGQTNAVYVDSLYQSGLGRPVDATGAALLTAALTNGQSHGAMPCSTSLQAWKPPAT